MDVTTKNSSINENTIVRAVIASMLLHVFLMLVLPNFKFEAAKKLPDILSVELQKSAPPAPEVQPEPPKPEPVKEVTTPKPVPKPITEKVQAPSPLKEETPQPPTPVEAPPKVIAAEPKADTTPREVVQAPPPIEKPKPPEPTQADVDNALGDYGGLLGRAIAKHKSYPKIAQMRGWEGEVKLDLKLDGNGNVLSAKIVQSSGHEALDNQALEMVKKASPFPAPPEALRSRTFNITVPVTFKLESA